MEEPYGGFSPSAKPVNLVTNITKKLLKLTLFILTSTLLHAGAPTNFVLIYAYDLGYTQTSVPGILPTHGPRAFGEAFGVGSDNYENSN